LKISTRQVFQPRTRFSKAALAEMIPLPWEWRMMAQCWAAGDWSSMIWSRASVWTAINQARWAADEHQAAIRKTKRLLRKQRKNGTFDELELRSVYIWTTDDLASLCMYEAECGEEVAS
jgi:hypothetical protein